MLYAQVHVLQKPGGGAVPGAAQTDTATGALQTLALQIAQERAQLQAAVLGIGRLGQFTVHSSVFDAPAYLRMKVSDIARNALRDAAPNIGYDFASH